MSNKILIELKRDSASRPALLNYLCLFPLAATVLLLITGLLSLNTIASMLMELSVGTFLMFIVQILCREAFLAPASTNKAREAAILRANRNRRRQRRANASGLPSMGRNPNC